MAIGSVVQSGNNVLVYNEKNGLMFSRPGQLVGYTASTVSVKVGNDVLTYNEKNGLVGSRRSS